MDKIIREAAALGVQHFEIFVDVKNYADPHAGSVPNITVAAFSKGERVNAQGASVEQALEHVVARLKGHSQAGTLKLPHVESSEG